MSGWILWAAWFGLLITMLTADALVWFAAAMAFGEGWADAWAERTVTGSVAAAALLIVVDARLRP